MNRLEFITTEFVVKKELPLDIKIGKRYTLLNFNEPRMTAWCEGVIIGICTDRIDFRITDGLLEENYNEIRPLLMGVRDHPEVQSYQGIVYYAPGTTVSITMDEFKRRLFKGGIK